MRFRQVSKVAGAFVLVAVLLLLSVLLLTARAQRWFAPVVMLTLVLPEEGSFGLRSGAPVEVLGTVAGSVDSIAIDERTDRMQARVAIDARFFRFVRADSVPVIRKRTLGLTGDAFLEIPRGKGDPQVADAVVNAIADRGPTDLLQDLGRDLQRELVPMLSEVRATLDAYRQVAQSVHDPQGEVQSLLGRANRLLGVLEQGEGIAGRLLMDKAWADELLRSLEALRSSLGRAQKIVDDLAPSAGQIVEEVRGTAARFHTLLDSLRGTTEALPELLQRTQRLFDDLQKILEMLRLASEAMPEIAGAARDQARALPALVRQSRQALGEVERLVQAVQRHWLISPYVEPISPTERLPPAAAGRPEGGR